MVEKVEWDWRMPPIRKNANRPKSKEAITTARCFVQKGDFEEQRIIIHKHIKTKECGVSCGIGGPLSIMRIGVS